MKKKLLFSVLAAAAIAGFLFQGFRLMQRLPDPPAAAAFLLQRKPLSPPPEAVLLPDATADALSPADEKNLLLYDLSKGESTEAVFTLSGQPEDLKFLKAPYLEAERLLQAGSKPADLPDNLKDLYKKVQDYRLQTIRRLISEGARAHSKDKLFGWTPLHWAAARKERALALLLLDHGAEVNAKDNNSWTPLHEAISNKDMETAVLLLDRGANVNAADKNGRTSLHEAAADGDWEIAALLLKRGADVNQQDNLRRSPLQHAKQAADPDVAALFSQYNFSLKLKRLILIFLCTVSVILAFFLLKPSQ